MALQAPGHIIPCFDLSYLVGVLHAFNGCARDNLLSTATYFCIVGRGGAAHGSHRGLAGPDGNDALAISGIVSHTAIVACYGCELRSQLAIDDSVVVFTILRNNGIGAALIIAYGVFKAEETQL